MATLRHDGMARRRVMAASRRIDRAGRARVLANTKALAVAKAGARHRPASPLTNQPYQSALYRA
jgi:hypothetical protein